MLCHSLRSVNFRVGITAVCAVLLLGCGSRPADSGSRTGSGSAKNGRFQLDIAHCAGFGPAEAAAILGLSAEKFRDKSENLSDSSRWCILENSAESARSVNFTVSQAASADEAATEFAQFRQHAAVATGTIGQGQKPHDIAGLGDEALWTSVPSIVHARKGRYSVQVNLPADEAVQIKIAHRILGE